jgi:hypothetical protein
MRAMRGAWWIGLLGIAACHDAPPGQTPVQVLEADAGVLDTGTKVEVARRAPVVVAIVVDQLAAWIAEERWPLLPESGGFARLRREGTWAVDMRYAHSVTDTAPGHAALFTGTWPRKTGIWANERMDVDLRVRMSILRDAETRLVIDTRLGLVARPARGGDRRGSAARGAPRRVHRVDVAQGPRRALRRGAKAERRRLV